MSAAARPAFRHTYRYLGTSALATGSRPALTLATSSPQGEAHPHFFRGTLRQPRLAAELLTAVHLVVGARFFTPPNMLARLIALADPVVTCGGGTLRFEGFSSCCSCYVRADLLPEAYDGELVGKGTTNVDFNAPMRAALARVRDGTPLALAVGREALELRSGGDAVIEKKVELPQRWLRGMLEVQAYQAVQQLRIKVPGLQALRFLRSLPRAGTQHTPLWLVGGPQGLRTTTLATPDGVRFTDTQRLRVLEPLLPKAQQLAVYTDPQQQASSWVLSFPGGRLTLLLSAEVWRGFSGEGQALRALLQGVGNGTLAKVRAALNWQPSLDPTTLAAELALPAAEVDAGLCLLGASGLAGFDLAAGRYFHRELPFDLSLAEDLHPRLAGARELLDQNAVTVLRNSPLEARVTSGDLEYVVREADGDLRCTCPWFAKYQGQRGPCKHVLAVEASVRTHRS